LTIAIAIHNIPEGLCIAIPIYVATESRWKAFLMAAVSGFAEVVAAGFAWIILSQVTNELVFGILFGIVAGMMVFISVTELLPAAFYAASKSEKKQAQFAVILGMAVIAASLIAFEY
jgi:ZIP family zinc transporter